MMLPRDRKPAKRTIYKDVEEVRVPFTLEQIRDALVARFGTLPVGPEESMIPRDANLVVEVHNNQPAHYLVWDEEPAKL